jgi:hypothetical protein
MDSVLEELRRTVMTAADGMTEEQLRWHPEGKWCAAEVLEHLYLSYTGTIKGLERVLGAGKPIITPAKLSQRIGILMVLTFNYLPEGRKAPKQTVPRGLAVEQVRSEFEVKIEAMDTILGECERRFGRGKILDHLILGPLTGAQWRKFHLVHGRHHAKQIRGLRERVKSVVSG